MKRVGLALAMALFLLALPAGGHSGGTDECGGHTDPKTGEYHVEHPAKAEFCGREPRPKEPRQRPARRKPGEAEVIECADGTLYVGNNPDLACPDGRAE